MKIRFRDLPLQGKISSIYIFANILVFVVNLILLSGIHTMSQDMEQVYEENLHLNELAGALADVQDSMTDPFILLSIAFTTFSIVASEIISPATLTKGAFI